MKRIIFALVCSYLHISPAATQNIYRPLPTEWEKLVPGGNFMDRFLPMPDGKLSSQVWGTQSVLPRYVDNGIEDDSISWWGGNIIKGDDGKYHFFLCGWREDNPDGHMGYKKYSVQYHTIGDNTIGPFKMIEALGAGHNTEIFQLNDGRYLIYSVDGKDHEQNCRYLISESLNGPWEKGVLPLDLRDRPVRIGGGTWFHNMSFAKREDGSVIMLSRQGSIWISKTGISPYNLITTKSIYPMVAGRYEDPVIWRDHIQYNAIVNDWIGRTAFYLRSKDGINWIVEDGRAYIPGIAVHKDGHVEDWYKFERIRMYQDEYGRAIQANFAVIDTIKHNDLANDRHSSKNIGVPLNPGMLLSLEDKAPITPKTKEIRLRIRAEKNFKPNEVVDWQSLRFGASSEVNYGRGAIALRSEQDGEDMIVVFEGKNHYIGEDVFAPKVLGKDKNGEMIFGYTRLPWINYIEPILSARKPLYKKGKFSIVVENHGQVASKETIMTLNGYDNNGQPEEWGSVKVPPVESYERVELNFKLEKKLSSDTELPVLVKILSRSGKPVLFQTSIVMN